MTAAGRLPITFSTPAGNASFEQALATATAAEAAGFTSVGFGDRPHDPMLDGWTLATAVAARTERIRLYHTTLNIPYRFPSVLAKESVTLDRISGGRLDLCLGAGGEANRPLYDTIGVPLGAPADRLTDLRDCIAILRGIWSNDRFSYTGRVYHVDGAVGQPKPVNGTIPIWVGARFPRSLRLTGQLADGFIKNGGWGSVEELKGLNDAVSAAARKAGRDPYAIRRILNGGLGFVARNQEELDAFRERGAANLSQASAANAPAWAGSQGLIGTTAQILETIRAYRDIGIDTFNVRFTAPEQAEQLKRFGSEIIPEAAKL